MVETAHLLARSQQVRRFRQRDKHAVDAQVAAAGLFLAIVESVNADGDLFLDRFPGEPIPVLTRFEPAIGEFCLCGWIGLPSGGQPVVFGALPDEGAPLVVRDEEGLAIFRVDPTAKTVDILNGAMLVGGPEVVTVTYAVDRSTAISTTSTVYVTHLETSLVLPAGTWAITTLYLATYYATTNAATGRGRVHAPVLGAESDSYSNAGERSTIHAASQGTVVSDGVAATFFRGQVSRQSGGGTGTVNTENGLLLATCRRTA